MRKTFYDKDNRFAVLDRVHRYRAIAANTEWEVVNLQKLVEESNSICNICSEPIDMEARNPNPLDLNIDHIVPLVKGGAHKTDNIQAVHKKCNSNKATQNKERRSK